VKEKGKEKEKEGEKKGEGKEKAEKTQEHTQEKGQEKPKEKTQEKGQEKGKQKGGGGGAAKPEVLGRLSLVVGRIINVEKHPEADSLYKEEIDLGEEKPRQVVSGLVKFVPIDQMQNRLVVVLKNIKPANMRKVRSEAMLICASDEDHTHVEIIDPPAGSVPGDIVTVEGEEHEPDGVINLSDKGNIFAKLQEHLKTNDNCVATFKGKELRSAKGTFSCKTLKNCHLS